MAEETKRQQLLEERRYIHEQIVEFLLLSILQKLPREEGTQIDIGQANEYWQLRDQRRTIDAKLEHLDTSG